MIANRRAHPSTLPPSDTSTHEGLIAISASLIALTTFAVALRLYSRRVQRLAYKTDDWILIPTLILFVGVSATAIAAATRHLMGYSTFSAPQARIFFACSTMQYLEHGFVKISALFFYYRVFCPPGYKTKFRSYLMWMVTIVVVWTLAFFLVQLAGCRHFSYFWSLDTKLTIQCAPLLNDLAVAQAATDAALELIVLVSPIPKIITLNTSISRRIGIAAVFLVGLASVGASLARLTLYARGEAALHNVTASAPTNPSYFNTSATWYAIFESGLALIAVNIPSVYWLWTNSKADAVFSSICNAVSISSLRSRKSGSQNDDERAAPETKARYAVGRQLRDIQYIAEIESTTSTQVHARGFDHSRLDENLPKNKVQVLHTIHQTSF